MWVWVCMTRANKETGSPASRPSGCLGHLHWMLEAKAGSLKFPRAALSNGVATNHISSTQWSRVASDYHIE